MSECMHASKIECLLEASVIMLEVERRRTEQGRQAITTGGTG